VPGNGRHAACPFGEQYARYWALRYELFSRFDEGIRVDAAGLYSAKPERISFEAGKLLTGDVVLDAFGGVGASAIGFARNGKKVICVEADAGRCAMIRNNVSVYGLSALVTVVHADVLQVKDRLVYDAVYLDPPWGGPDYARRPRFMMKDFDPGGDVLLRSFADVKEVLLTVPVNFDFSGLAKYRRDYLLRWETLGGERVFANVLFRSRML